MMQHAFAKTRGVNCPRLGIADLKPARSPHFDSVRQNIAAEYWQAGIQILKKLTNLRSSSLAS
jgi:hypothetical protein